MHLCYIHCPLCGRSLNANMFLCHLFSLCLILPKSLSFHTSVHFSSLPINAFISQQYSDGGARVYKPQHWWWGNRRQQIVLKPFNLRFLVCPCARNSALQHNSHSSSRFPSATCSTSLLWPQHPILCFITQLKSSRAHSLSQLEHSMKENEVHLMFSPGWSHS